jgi:hypothetical protein
MTEPAAEAGLWLTQGEAAAALGWHIERLRAAAKRGKLQRRKNNQGQWLVLVPPQGISGAALGHAPDSGAAMPQAALAHAQGMEEALVELRQGLTEERAGRARAEGELAAELRRSADLVLTVATLRTDLADARRELADARKGWLERVLEAVRRRP